MASLSVGKVVGIVVGVAVGMTLGPKLFDLASGVKELKSLPEPALVAGEIRVAPAGKQFSLVLPKGWVTLDASSPEFKAALKENAKSSPALSSLVDKIDSTRFAAYAIEVRSAAEPLPRTVNVIRNETGRPLRDPAKAAQQLAEALTSQVPGVKIFESGAATVPIGVVPRVISSLPIPGVSGGTNPTTTVSYAFVVDGKSFNLTVTGAEKDKAEVTQLAEKIAASFRITE